MDIKELLWSLERINGAFETLDDKTAIALTQNEVTYWIERLKGINNSTSL